MPAVVITMLVVLVAAFGIIVIVWMGMRGLGRDSHPELASAMERTARHLNGDAEPPKPLMAIVDEIEELPVVSRRSAASATSAPSATAPEVEPEPVPVGADSQVEIDPDAPYEVDPVEDTVVHAKLPGGRPRH